MGKSYYLMKSEPETWSWEQQKKKKTEHWDGVRNYQAAKYMKQMKIGDECLFYHSVSEKAIKGIVKVSKECLHNLRTMCSASKGEIFLARSFEEYQNGKAQGASSTLHPKLSIILFPCSVNARELIFRPILAADIHVLNAPVLL
mgnify:CR=1 FL=1